MHQELETTDVKNKAQLRQLEKSNKVLKQEKEDLQRDLQELQDRYKSQTKDLRDAITQRKIAMEEFTDINERLADLRANKQKLSRQLRDREEEIEEERHKCDTARQVK